MQKILNFKKGVPFKKNKRFHSWAMKLKTLLVFCCFSLIAFGQFTLSEGYFTGKNIHQKDIDDFFSSKQNTQQELLSLDFEYVDSILVLPNFKNLEILSIESQVLKKLIFVDTLPLLAIIDLNTPSLESITTVAVPELFQLSLKANLKTLPSFICEANNLNHVSIENYTSVSEPQCWEERIENQFEYSTLEIYDHYEGELIYESNSADFESMEDDYEDYDIELEGYDKKMLRRVTIFRRSIGFFFSGLLFLIWKS